MKDQARTLFIAGKLTTMTLLLTLSLNLNAAEVNFDFQDADLRTVIQAVSEFTGKNFLVDPRVKGKVTVVAPDPLSEAEAYKAFLSVLEINGYVTVDSEGMTKIVPQEEGKTRNTLLNGHAKNPNRDDMITKVLRLEHIQAERIVPLLRPLIPAYGHMAADATTSSLIITDRVSNLERLVNIIKRLDRPTASGEIEIVQLSHASAEELARLLGPLHKGVEQENQSSGAAVIMADSRTNTLIIKADPTTRKQVKSLAMALDTPSESGGNTHVVYLKNANAENMVEVLQATIKGSGENAGGRLTGAVSLTADPATNSLVVTASKSDFITLRGVIEQLDIRRLQVYVEALIAEVRMDSLNEFGIQFQSADGLRSDNRGVVGGSNFNVGTSIAEVLTNPLAAGAGLNVGFIDGTVTLPDGTEVLNLSVLARALDSVSDANVLSTPNILTMDNQEAEIVIGQNVPFVTGSFAQIAQGTAVQNPFQTIERQDVGLRLNIKPQITEGGSIKMEIFQEVSSVAQRGEASDIVTNTRSLQTTVIAENDRMLVLGGLIQDDIIRNEQKVPVLGDIPVLGNLFRYRSKDRKKTNLLVFLRPRLIRSVADMDEPTRQKYQYLGEVSERQELRTKEDELAPISDWDLVVPGQAMRPGQAKTQ